MTTHILITGIGGYIGSSIAYTLVRHPTHHYQVSGIGRNTKFPLLREKLGHTIVLAAAEITDKDALRNAAKGCDLIIHTVSPVNERYCKEHYEDASRTIVDGTRNVAAVAVAEKCFLIHFSTQSVYSTNRVRPMPLTEEDDLTPDTAYGTLKALAEKEIERVPSALILRLTNIYGSGKIVPLHMSGVTGKFLTAALQKSPITLYGDGSQGIDFVHIDDLTGIIEELIQKRSTLLPRVLNIGAGHATSIRALAETYQEEARRILHHDIELITLEQPPAEKLWPTRYVSNVKAKHIAPWFPRVPLSEGIREMIIFAHGQN